MTTLRFVLVATALLCASCTSNWDTGGLEGSDSFESRELRDWVSYADQISVARVASETAIPPSADDVAGGLDKKFLGRRIHIVIERNLWVAPGVTPRTEFDGVGPGWSLDHEGNKHPITPADSLRLELGDRVVMPISRDAEGGPTLLSPHAIVPVSGKLHGLQNSHNLDPSVKALKGKSFDEMAEILSRTEPDPIAAKYMDLPPYQRQDQVGVERRELQQRTATESPR
jgi:hypothetical protein